MKKCLDYIPIKSNLKLLVGFCGILILILIIFTSPFIIISGNDNILQSIIILISSIFYGILIFCFVVTLIWIYNLIALKFGGLEFHTSEIDKS